MNQPKEELQKDPAVEQSIVEGLENRDKKLRKEFAKAFKWFDKKNPYDSSIEYRTPSWEEIFVEVGRLLNTQSLANIEKKVTEQGEDIIIAFNQIRELENNK